MRVLFFGNNENNEKFLEFLNERNSQAVLMTVDGLLLLENFLRIGDIDVVVLDLTSVPGSTQKKKFLNLGGIEKWNQIKRMIYEWLSEDNSRVCHCISDCVLGLHFLEKNGEVKLYFSSLEKSATLSFPASRFEAPLEAALHTAASQARNRWKKPV